MDKIKVMLCIPPIPIEAITGELGKFWNIGSSMPPQGLCRIAAISRLKGYDTRILDCQVMRLTPDKAVKHVMEFSPDFVGISSSTVSIKSAGLFARMIKDARHSIKTIIGGPHISALREGALKEFSGFDIGVIGEGDDTFQELVETILAGSPLSGVAGIVFRDGDKIISTPARPLIKNLDSLPMPAWDMLPQLSRFYRTSAQRSKDFPVAAILTSRGCPFDCSFCDKSVFGHTLRTHSSGYVMDMVRTLKHKHGMRAIVFNDDLFTVNKKRLAEICETMIRDKLKLAWSCNGRLNMADLETLKLMKRAGCWQIALGIESGDQEILNFMNKKIQLDTIKGSVELIKKAGISVKAFFIFGMPIDTKEKIRKTIDFAKKIQIDDVQFSNFTPYPGTRLYNYVTENEGFRPEWDKMNTISPFYVPKGLSADDLSYYQKTATKEFYFRLKPICSQISKLKNPRYAVNVAREMFYFLNYMFKK